MAVNFTLGFEDQYSQEFQRLVQWMEQQQQQTEKLKKSTDDHTQSLKRMAKEHQDAARAMKSGAIASGSLTTGLSKTNTEANRAAMSGKSLSSVYTGLAPKVLAVVAALKAAQMGLEATGVSADGVINNWIRFKAHTEENTDAIVGFISKTNILAKVLKEISESEWYRGKDSEIRAKAEQAFRDNLKATLATEQAMHDVRQANTQAEVRAMLEAEVKTRREQENTAAWTKERAAQSFQVEAALTRRKIELQRNYTAEVKRLEIENAEASRVIQENLLDFRLAKIDEEHKRRAAILGMQKRLEAQTIDHGLRLIQDRITREIDAEKEADLKKTKNTKERARIETEAEEKKHTQIQRLEEKSILNRAEMETKLTTDKIEQAKIAARAIEEIRELEFQHALELEQRKVEIAKNAADMEVAIEREKIEKLKALTDDKGKNVYQNLMGQQAGRKGDKGESLLLEEMVKRRMSEEKKADPNMSRQREIMLTRFVRRMTAQGKTTSGDQTSEAEVQEALTNMASAQVLKAKAQGKVNQRFVTMAAEQLAAEQEQGKFNEEVAQQLKALTDAGKTQQQVKQEQTERLKAQRRAIRR